MPCFQDIDVAIVIGPDWTRLPEYPHPDGSPVRAAWTTDVQVHDKNSDLPSSAPRSQIGHVAPSPEARISTYIPSVPGSQFAILYSIAQISEPPVFYYFKALINGRTVTNWGIDPAEKSTGTVHRALCEPGDKWHYRDNGVTLKRQGIEARSFYFLPYSTSSTVANDGGLIEVQVFRAKGRRRRAVMLDQHRGQDQYGIASPSTGLLESPEEAAYYDWILQDPKHRPFATFRFHYRSPSNLQFLHLWHKEGGSIQLGPDPGTDHLGNRHDPNSASYGNGLNSPSEAQQQTDGLRFKLAADHIAATASTCIRKGSPYPHRPLEQPVSHITANTRLLRLLPEVPHCTGSQPCNDGNAPAPGHPSFVRSPHSLFRPSKENIAMAAGPARELSLSKSDTCPPRPLSPVLENPVQQTDTSNNNLDLVLSEGQWMKGDVKSKTWRHGTIGEKGYHSISAGDEDDGEMF